jgi:group I intron endonuclease
LSLLAPDLPLSIEILGGLFQTSPLIQIPIILGGFSFIEEPNILLSLISIIVYPNAETDKSTILTDTKGKTGIYMWKHKESDKIYVGSAVDLSKRLKSYFTKSYLDRENNYIYNALSSHTYSAFSLSIVEFIDISGLSDLDARKLILEREQYYLDQIFSVDKPNTYNILKVAGSSLGYKHSDESLAKMSQANKGESNPFYGRIHSAEFKSRMSEANKGKVKSEETKQKMSEAKVGQSNPMFSRTHSAESKTKMSLAKGTTIYVYNTQGSLVYTFSSARKAAEHLKCSHVTITNYIKNGKLLQDVWKLLTSPAGK